ncbi:ATP-binding protein [Trichocoleus desertorum AS-A10]|uniref:sensor histidine kinase n=1 Tax=Trichocoleus desertorum TaxID=1481672 RepID=UPI0032972217
MAFFSANLHLEWLNLTGLNLVWLDGAANLVIAACYLMIAGLISLGLWRNRCTGIDAFAAITAGIFWSGSWSHAAHATSMVGLDAALSGQTFFDAIAVIPAIAFLSLRRRSSLLIGSTQVLASQKQLVKRNAELEKKIDRRTQELETQNQRLNEALTALQKMNLHLAQTEKMSMLGQMVSGISHEINNPINFIHGNLPYMEEHVGDLLALLETYRDRYPQETVQVEAASPNIELDFIVEDLPRIMNSMRLGTERIREIVLNLRNFYRLDEAEMKPADLEAGIESTLVLLQNRYKQKIEIVRQFGKIPLVECHINQLNQVFMNLLSNSIDALLEGELSPDSTQSQLSSSLELKQIVIKTDTVGANRVGIWISDNGPGITVDVQEHLFEPFFTTKPRGVGTGLGLSISHQIITEAHQGRIYCCSTPGEGTTFAIELPLQQTESLSQLQNCGSGEPIALGV